jgi:hypothetical protein
MTNINKWLDVFVEEKGINLERAFEFTTEDTWNYMPVGAVIEFIKNLPINQQIKIKNTLVIIDFKNGNVYHFLEYIAKGIAKFGGN